MVVLVLLLVIVIEYRGVNWQPGRSEQDSWFDAPTPLAPQIFLPKIFLSLSLTSAAIALQTSRGC